MSSFVSDRQALLANQLFTVRSLETYDRSVFSELSSKLELPRMRFNLYSSNRKNSPNRTRFSSQTLLSSSNSAFNRSYLSLSAILEANLLAFYTLPTENSILLFCEKWTFRSNDPAEG